MISVHHLGNSRSQRVLWLLEELNVPYQLVEHNRGRKTRPVESIMEIHPLGKAPILCDDSQVIAETGAIFEYLLEKFNSIHLKPPSGTNERIQYVFWTHFAEGSFMQ